MSPLFDPLGALQALELTRPWWEQYRGFWGVYVGFLLAVAVVVAMLGWWE